MVKLRHITEDKLIFGLTVFVGSILLFFIGGIIWGLFRVFDPNFVETGPFFAFYQTKDCALASTNNFEVTPGCKLISGHGTWDFYKDNPLSIQESLKQTLSASQMGGYPTDPSKWQCNQNGRIIYNNNEKLDLSKLNSIPGGQDTYRCWPI